MALFNKKKTQFETVRTVSDNQFVDKNKKNSEGSETFPTRTTIVSEEIKSTTTKGTETVSEKKNASQRFDFLFNNYYRGHYCSNNLVIVENMIVENGRMKESTDCCVFGIIESIKDEDNPNAFIGARIFANEYANIPINKDLLVNEVKVMERKINEYNELNDTMLGCYLNLFYIDKMNLISIVDVGKTSWFIVRNGEIFEGKENSLPGFDDKDYLGQVDRNIVPLSKFQLEKDDIIIAMSSDTAKKINRFVLLEAISKGSDLALVEKELNTTIQNFEKFNLNYDENKPRNYDHAFILVKVNKGYLED